MSFSQIIFCFKIFIYLKNITLARIGFTYTGLFVSFLPMVNNFLDALPSYVVARTKNLDLKIRSVNANNAIDAVLSKTVLAGGKRLRPLLTYLMADLFNVDLDVITPYARATELVHAASLCHDDVIDNATIRRGKPSINILASNKKAVLAGDYLLSSVIVDLSNAGNLELLKNMSLVIKDLSEGEWLQNDLVISRDYTRDLIREIAMKKTASVMSYCTETPAIYSNQSKLIQDESKKFGINLGIAFQLVDDTLDYSDSSLKDSALDLNNGIINSVVFELFSQDSSLMKSFQAGNDMTALLVPTIMKSPLAIIKSEAEKYLMLASENLAVIERELNSNDPKTKQSIESLQLIVSYLALRKN
jgi:octaprenyl-diphosphate synthase